MVPYTTARRDATCSLYLLPWIQVFERSVHRQMDNNRNLDDSQEPLFSKQGHSLKENLIQDVYSILVQKNQANIECRRKPRCFSHGKIVEGVLLMCDYFQQRQEARYIAIVLVERFLSAKCAILFGELSASTQRKKDKFLQWRNFMESLKEQAFLYIIACCQIAFKICCHQQTVSNKQNVQLMQGITSTSTVNNIALCELDVLQSVNYELPFTTILTFTETLLGMLGSNQNYDFSIKTLHNVCLKILDLVCLRRYDIFDRLFESTVENITGLKERSKFVMVENDDLLLSTGVIETATYISNKEKHMQDRPTVLLGDFDRRRCVGIVLQFFCKGPN
ncbi:cyclin N-terminal domain-containing protein 1-like isoform X2 [Apostichopus japonicus]|uniref:cyclin N-terminal domain-containing protein 1-like isoform X2 n=1 Tax=Stichopus japonicus TaxID=307972 RepID=UPI003AB5550A